MDDCGPRCGCAPGMTPGALILRLSLLPMAGLYALLSTSTEAWVVLPVAGLLLAGLAALILRGLGETPSPFESGAILVVLAALTLAPLPLVASWVTPGLCTDGSLWHEIALIGFAYCGMALFSHHCAKALLPAHGQSLTRSERGFLDGLRIGPLAFPALPIGVTALILIDRGACVPGTPHLITGPLLTLPMLGALVFLGSAARRRQTFLKGRKP